MTRTRKIVVGIALASTLTVLAVFVAALIMLRPAVLKRHLESELREHLRLDAHVESISLSLAPSLRVSGRNFTLRIPNRPDLPTFVAIEHFWVDVGVFSILRKHVGVVHAGGLKINMPPGPERRELTRARQSPDGGVKMSDVIIDRFVTHDAELVFVPRKAGKRPLTFAIHDLTVTDIGFDRPMPFTTRLTNPVPRGEVQATGSIGPWNRDEATLTPVGGKYTFTDADLGTINGIGGTLQSRGEFSGELTAIRANGQAEIPNFSLDLGGKPVPLTAAFQTVVDGTDGTTILERVHAKLINTQMTVSGAVTNLSGPGRHQVDLKVAIEDGRIEDLISLAIDAPQPVMTGDVTLQSTLSLPPGPARVRDRLLLGGKFGLGKARFTDKQVQTRMQELSRRSQGKDIDDPIGRVMTSLAGTFALKRGILALSKLTFEVPGANVLLDGTYQLADGGLDFQGTLTMKATVSQAVGGFKSIFIKPFDGLFRKNDAGAVVPIKITGTREAPKFGLQVGKVFGGDH